MQFVCDAPGDAAWFRIETEAEAEAESALMRHAVERFFRRYQEAARACYRPPRSAASFEQAIGLKDHVARVMPLFLTLRASDGTGLATAMLPPGGRKHAQLRPIIVGPSNSDPFATHGPAIAALGAHFALTLNRDECYPY